MFRITYNCSNQSVPYALLHGCIDPRHFTYSLLARYGYQLSLLAARLLVGQIAAAVHIMLVTVDAQN